MFPLDLLYLYVQTGRKITTRHSKQRGCKEKNLKHGGVYPTFRENSENLESARLDEGADQRLRGNWQTARFISRS